MIVKTIYYFTFILLLSSCQENTKETNTSSIYENGGCVVVQQNPYITTKSFRVIDECREEVKKMIQKNKSWQGFIDDSQNKIGIETYNFLGFGNLYPIFIDR